MRVVTTLEADDEAVRSALERSLPYAGVVSLRTRAGMTALTLLRLARLRPVLVIAEASGRSALAASIYCAIVRKSRLLLRMPATPPRRPSWITRFALSRAHEVLEAGVDLTDVIERVRPRPASAAMVFRTVPPDLDIFAAIPATRAPVTQARLLHVGPLSPESGAADLLVALASWAEQNPERNVEICWAGTGDLAGVFEAQPLPDNLAQHFVGDLDRRGLAEAFAAASIMVVPLAGSKAPIIEALAAGLVLIGERRTPALRATIGAGGPVWAFDASGRPDLATALNGALNASPATLAALQRAGRNLALGATLAGAEPGRALPQGGRLVSDAAFP